MFKKIYHHLYYRIRNYHNEIINLNFGDFNKFIITVFLKHVIKTDVIVPSAIGFIIVLLSIQSLTQDTIFFPQNNIPTYITFVLFQFGIALATIYIIPLITIIVLNSIFTIFHNRKSKLILPAKLLITITIYYAVLSFLNQQNKYHITDQILVISLWLLMYFSCVNMFISYSKHRTLFKFTKIKLIFLFLFIILSIEPVSMVLLNISKSTDYVRINHNTYITSANCNEMIVANSNIESSNYILNNTNYFESTQAGCTIHKNVIRSGFSSDYVVMIRKNIYPIKESDGKIYNYYTRIACYSNNCFIDNDIRKNSSNDEYFELIPFPS